MNATVAWLTFRGLFGRRRFLLLLPLPVLLVLAAALLSTVDFSAQGANAVVEGLGFAVVLPVLALIIGTSVLGSEIDDGTVVHILAKPVPRLQIILAKYVVAAGAAAVSVGVPMFIAGTLLDSPASAAPSWWAAWSGSWRTRDCSWSSAWSPAGRY